jgi:hypothetical protein
MDQGRGRPSTTSQLPTLVLASFLLCTAALPGVTESTARARVAQQQGATPPPPGIPETPARSEVSRALGARGADVRSCALLGKTGAVTVRVTFESSGAVQSAVVTSTTPLSDTVRSCIAEAVQKARVRPFRNSAFIVTFPFRW